MINFIYTITALRDGGVTSRRVSEATTTVPHRGNYCAYYYLVTPTSSLSNRMDDAIETIKETHLEREDNMLNNKLS